MSTQLLKPSLLGLLLGTILLSGCDKQEDQSQDATSLLDRAAAYEKNGQYRAAFIEIKNALSKDPASLPAKLKIAELQLSTGQPKSASLTLESISPAPVNDKQYVDLYAESLIAQEKFKTALQFIEKNQTQCSSRCLSLKGDALLAIQDTSTAEKTYSQALQADGKNIYANLGLVKTYLQTKQVEKANVLLDSIIEKNPDSTDALLLKASTLINAGQQANAEDILNKALFTLPSTDVITPKRIIIIEKLVDILTLQGRTEEALTYSKSLADLDPKGSELRSMMDEAIALYNAKNYEGARAILEKINQESSSNQVKTLLGVIDYLSGDFAAASTMLEGGINIESSTTTTKSILVNSYLVTGQTEKALAFLGKDYQTNGDDPETINLYANTLLRTGKFEEAYPLLEKSLKLKPDQANIHVAKFYYHLQIRDTESATKDITTAYKLAPQNQSILSLYFGFKARSKMDEAISELDAVIANNQNNAYLHYFSGYLYTQKQALEKAAGAYKKSLEIDSDLKNPAHLALAKLYLLDKKYDSAIELYTSLINKGMDFADAYKGIITAYELKNDINSAIELVTTQAVEKQSIEARRVLAEYYILNKNTKAAIEQLDLANNEKVEKTGALNALLLAVPTDARDDTLNTFKRLLVKAISNQPKNTALFYKLIDLELANKNLTSATELNNKLKGFDTSYGPYFYGSKIAQLENRGDEALTIAKAGWEALKTDEAGNYYFNFLTARKLPTEAFIDEWIKSIPDSINGRLYKALAIQASDTDGAIRIYEDLLKIAPDSYRILNNLAWIYQEKGDSRALATAENAFKANPNDAAVLDTYGWILFKAGQTAKAEEILANALKLQPDQAEIRDHYNTVKAANAK